MKTILLICALCFALGAGAAAAGEVVIAEQNASWEMAYGDVYYRAFGQVENKSTKPVKYLKLQLELLDKDGKAVVTRTGYNAKAESLGGVEGYESEETPEQKLARIEPIKPGEKDLFRLGVGKNEIPTKPRFTSYRLRIVETK